MSAWARLVAKATFKELEELNAALVEIQQETRARVARGIRASRLSNPLGEAEEHVNNVLDDLADRIERGRLT